MAGGCITLSNPLTMHHIVRRADGGATNEHNGSAIGHLEHSGIHIIGDRNIKRGNEIKCYFHDYKAQIKRYEDIKSFLLGTADMRTQFQAWLQAELMHEGMRACRTHDNLLVYRRK